MKPFLEIGDCVTRIKPDMIFKIDSEVDAYVKVIKITPSIKEQIHCFYYSIDEDYFCTASYNLNECFRRSSPSKWILVEKVPSKIVKIQEERTIYISSGQYEELLKYGCIMYGILFSKKLFTQQELDKGEVVELCKIQVTKKELEFNWDKGIYE